MADVRKMKTSNLWNCFEDFGDSVNKIANFKICQSKISYKSSTSNLKKHLERKHPTVLFFSTRPHSSTVNPQSTASTSAFNSNFQELNVPTTYNSSTITMANNSPARQQLHRRMNETLQNLEQW